MNSNEGWGGATTWNSFKEEREREREMRLESAKEDKLKRKLKKKRNQINFKWIFLI